MGNNHLSYDSQTNWDQMARRFHEFSSQEYSYSRQVEHPAIIRLLGDIGGQDVLDVGCGSGLTTFLLESLNPSSITGIDLSSEMIALAETSKQATGSRAKFQVGDGMTLENLPDQAFDLVFSSTTTHYFSSLEDFFRSCRRVLKEQGQLLISIIHPVYSAQYPIDRQDDRFPSDCDWEVRYLDRRERAYLQPWIEYTSGPKFLTRSYHYTFSDYFQVMSAAGFRLLRLEEPEPPQIYQRLFLSRYEAYQKTPTFALLLAKLG